MRVPQKWGARLCLTFGKRIVTILRPDFAEFLLHNLFSGVTLNLHFIGHTKMNVNPLRRNK